MSLGTIASLKVSPNFGSIRFWMNIIARSCSMMMSEPDFRNSRATSITLLKVLAIAGTTSGSLVNSKERENCEPNDIFYAEGKDEID
jgi:hypothetical protein